MKVTFPGKEIPIDKCQLVASTCAQHIGPKKLANMTEVFGVDNAWMAERLIKLAIIVECRLVILVIPILTKLQPIRETLEKPEGPERLLHSPEST